MLRLGGYRCDDFVTPVGLTINCVAFVELQNEREASPLGVNRSQFRSPVNTTSLLSEKTFTYFGISSFSRQKPYSGGQNGKIICLKLHPQTTTKTLTYDPRPMPISHSQN